MRKMTELNNESKRLGGSIVLEMVAGPTIAEMVVGETITCTKEEFISKKNELARQGKYFVLVAEPGRETMEQAIKAFLKEQARQARQTQFYKEVWELHEVKLEKKRVEALLNNPKVTRIKNIIESMSGEDEDDIRYITKLLVKDLCLPKDEKDYILKNILG